ncbi:uncharacterized protein JCM6883_001237 [Sporobolomyces salmoneus]|uniref:uncharacterized protein n=1 Tax=Sporobolomyces salmoneus TaxID=183962 RepID=UPI00317DDBB9
MPPRKSTGGNSPGKATKGAELDQSRARFDLPLEADDEKLALAPIDQKKKDAYQPGAPIKFYDDEVKRMHSAIDEQAESDRRTARRSLRQPPRRRKGVTLTGFVMRVGLLYLAIAYFVVCPNDTSRERAVCRKIDTFSSTLRSYEPSIRPYYRRAQRRIDPYVRQGRRIAQPWFDQAKPYYTPVEKTVSPRIKQVSRFYSERIYPKLVSAVKTVRSRTRPFALKVEREYKKTLAPSVDWYSKSLRKWYTSQIEPSTNQFDLATRRYLKTIVETVSPLYTRGVPLVKHHYRSHLVPFTRSTYSTTHRVYFSHVHPQLATVSSHLQGFYASKISPSLLRFWSKFIAPQLDKIRERIFEFKAKEARVAALKRVEKVSDEIAHQHGEEDFEDFVKELRDDTYVGETASPVVIEAEETEVTPPSYSASVPPPPPSPEEQAAITAEKRTALELLQSTYEREIASLGQTEQRLLIERLADIRQKALDDIPCRFDSVLETLDEEGDKMVGKLGKYFNKVSGDDSASIEKKVDDSETLSSKALRRVEKMKQKVDAEIEQYRLDLVSKEEAAVEEAKKSITTLVAKAQEELGFGWTWLDDVTHKDWQRYHGLRKAEENLHTSFSNLQTGDIRDSTLSTLDPNTLLDKYAKQSDALVSAFTSILDKIKIKGQREIKGEWTGVANEAQKAYEVVGDKVANVVDHVKDQAASAIGVEHETTPTNIRQSMASLASAAQSSASSLVNALPTVKTPHSASNLRQSAGYVVNEVQYRAAEAIARASQDGLRAVGIEPSPTDLQQSATSLVGFVSSALSSVGDVASSLAQPHTDFSKTVSKALPTVRGGGGGGERIKASLDSLARSASSALHDATRTTAEGIVETASSLVEVARNSLNSFASPHPSYSKSTAAASVKSIVDEVTGSLASATVKVKSVAHEATGGIKTALHVEL